MAHTPLHQVVEVGIAGTPTSKIIAYMMSGKFLDAAESIRESDRALSVVLSCYELACISVANEFMREHAELEKEKNPLTKKRRDLLKSKAQTAMRLMADSVSEFHDLSYVVRLGVRSGFVLVDMGKLTCPECSECFVSEHCPGAKFEDACGWLW